MPALLAADQLAQRLGVTRATVARWARDGRIPSHRVGKRTWFVLAEVQAATFQPAKAPSAAVATGQSDAAQPEELARYLEIIGGRQARGDGRAVAGAGRRRKRG